LVICLDRTKYRPQFWSCNKYLPAFFPHLFLARCLVIYCYIRHFAETFLEFLPLIGCHNNFLLQCHFPLFQSSVHVSFTCTIFILRLFARLSKLIVNILAFLLDYCLTISLFILLLYENFFFLLPDWPFLLLQLSEDFCHWKIGV